MLSAVSHITYITAAHAAISAPARRVESGAVNEAGGHENKKQNQSQGNVSLHARSYAAVNATTMV
jgi:hypothetical protein